MSNNLKVVLVQHNQKRTTYHTISYAEAIQHTQANPFQRQERWMDGGRAITKTKKTDAMYMYKQPQRGIQCNTSEQEGTVNNRNQGIHKNLTRETPITIETLLTAIRPIAELFNRI